ASEGMLVTFGIVPQHPETGYGYIQAGEIFGTSDAFNISKFVEKPNIETAKGYLASGDFYWNSGMFMFRADRFLEELGKFRPDILEACKKSMAGTANDMDFLRVDKSAFEACPDESVDYAVMEKTESAVVIPLDAGWSDVGSWSALWEIKDKDESGNVTEGDVIALDTDSSLIMAKDRLVTTLGVSNLIVIDTPDALLVADKNHIQEVKRIVSQIKESGRNECFQHREVYRPWGKYDSIDMGERYQVKRITVKPGAKLSLQKHHHRAEHWIVVEGTASVTKGNETFLVTEDQSTYIPIGELHCLENPGKVDLELIEIQSGSYLGEDDIVRLEDKYGRA
ncbi:mannose-1-phosphate guanylyltransferase/mannose-6-phosphate isomerase, partial [Neptuniibacter sp. UBA847]